MIARVTAGLLGAAALAGVIGAAWWGFRERTSPGPLHPIHAADHALRERDGCAACHGTGGKTASFREACVSCHGRVGGQLASGAGIHGKLDAASQDRCEKCHVEHVGDLAPLVGAAVFTLAGVPDLEKYDHAHVGGLGLGGVHSTLACEKCHPLAHESFVAKGQSRFLGLDKACATCHEDVHKGELGADCARCHGQERPFKECPLFKHPETMPLTGGHAGRQCSACHTTKGEFTGAPTLCRSCHLDTFEATRAPAHKAAGLGESCQDCHSIVSWTKEIRFTHPERVPLGGAHEGVACAACHNEPAAVARVAAFKASPSCEACHESPHEPEFVRAAGAMLASSQAGACAACHAWTERRWPRATVSREIHAATGFPLVAPHDTPECAACHAADPGATSRRSEAPWREAFPGRAKDACEACHKDPHAGQFVGSTTQGACLSCHEPLRFAPPAFDASRHGECGFALEGGHRAVACAICHKVEDGVRRFVGVTRRCADCHEDVHKGAFDGSAHPVQVEGRSDCARCHTTREFARVEWTPAQHAGWTGEALTGKHATAACDDCHRRGPSPRAGRSAFREAPRACAACHQDVHAGQFSREGTTDCARCHISTERFADLSFDHNRDTRFALDQDHAALACDACHRPQVVRGKRVVRYVPLGTQCADCHGAPTRKGDR